jgi:hypothetical protein
MPRKAPNKKRLAQEQARRLLASYAESHDRCAICHFRKYRPGRRMEIHHIVGRFGPTPHNHRGLVMLCNTCHHAVHNRVPPPFDGLKNAHVLTAKEEEDGEVDLVYLAGCRRKKHLGYDPEPIPKAYLDERSENDEQ